MELSTDLLKIALAIPTVVALLSWWYAYKCWDFCRDTEEFIKKWAKEPPPGLAKLTSIETELTEHADSLEALHASLKKLRARVGMRENRAAKTAQDSDIPDPTTDPAGYKRVMRLKLQSGTLK